MKKEKLDFLALVILVAATIVYLMLTSQDFNLKNSFLGLLPFITISALTVYPIRSTKLLFTLFLLIFFFLFYDSESIIDWTSYLLTFIFSFSFALVCTYLGKHTLKKQPRTSLKGTFIGWLRNKKPDISNLVLFLLNFLLIFISINIFNYLIFSGLNLFILFVSLIIGIYSSFSEIYFFIILPSKKRE
ncbi:hypothetical protein [Vagococcus carniphilus]|nr:hypothetical protein [Vagococcus carniphilus]QNN72775.1 hypothetical protein H9L18_13080 [Vagococcus carniphilus]